MRKLVGIFKNRWFVSILGLLAITIAVWLFGPLIGFGNSRPLESGSARVIATLLIFLAWVLNHLRKYLKASRAEKGMVDGIVDAEASAEPDRSAEEIATLKGRFEEAVSVLKKSKGKRSRLNLYDLPWYIIIGPPGSGKTTALVNSGLDFPLADRFGREALSGVGGTRNCDWWFTDQAILLDTAGRYTTQDSDSDVDRAAWEGFLGLLKKHRRRRPINGVLVAISLLDLMTQNDQQRAAHARAIKTRIQELDQYFKIRFPVYVVVTKCDLVAGFTEFFDDLTRTDREQVWGMTFPIEASESASGAVDSVGGELEALLERLNSRLLWRMSQERDSRRRSAIYGFPRQLASLKTNLESFLGDVFRGSRFEQAPMLRGVYFTSGTQEGTPIDRLMGMVARTFGLDQQAVAAQGGQGRSYFIKSLLTDVVFAESELAGTNRKLESQRLWLQRAAYAGSLVAVVLMLVGWTVSYFNNRSLIVEVQAATDVAVQTVGDVSDTERDILGVLPALEAARTIPAGYASRDEGTPWLHGLGLYQGRKLGTQAESAYRRVLTNVLLPRLILRMEAQLRAGGPSPDFQYEVLKAYLMLDSRDHYSAEEVIGWLTFDLGNEFERRVGTEQFDVLLGHLEALFIEQPIPLPLSLDQNLIEQTQRVVARMPTEERIYSRLKRRSTGGNLPAFTLFNAAGPRAASVFVSRNSAGLRDGIDGLFTREGYRVFSAQSALEAADLIDETWILGDYAPANLDQAFVINRVRNLYFDEYARNYENFLNDIDLAPFATADEASLILNTLSDPVNSPLLLLLRAVAEETQLESRAEQLASAVGNRARGTVDNLRGLFGGNEPAAEAAESQVAANLVEERFRWLHDFVGGGDATSPQMENLLSMLDELYVFMATVAAESGSGGTISQPVAEAGQETLSRVQMAASRQPDIVQNLLVDATSRSRNLAFEGVRANLNAEWQSRGLAFCERAVAARYPLVRTSAESIQLEDFGAFFGPDGIVDTFFREYLADYVDTSRSPWRVRSSANNPVEISAAALSQFERADLIRQTFFRAGGSQPSVTFELQPIGMDANINIFRLNLAGQQIAYEHGPIRPAVLTWPGVDLGGAVTVQMTPPLAGDPSTLREEGPWAWFRLLDQADITATDSPERFELTFNVGSREALYELIARSAYNPFRFPELEEFSCPASL